MRKSRRTTCLFLSGFLLACGVKETGLALVISEIHYNPIDGNEPLEFLELTNDAYSPEDLSGWALIDGVRFTFPPGTVLRAREVLVVCADVDALKEAYGIENAIGNFEGRLDSGGERITLVNHAGAEIASVRYDDRGKWPTAADGTGHTLVLNSLYQDVDEPENWRASPELGGSPGLRNFARDREGGEDLPVAPLGTEWRFRRGSGPFSEVPLDWTLPDFDDTSWETGPSGFGFGNVDDLATVIEGMRGKHTSLALRFHFEVSDEELATSVYLLQLRYDDGFCAFINGVDFASGTCPEDIVWDSRATRSHDATPSSRTIFSVPTEHLRLGNNVLAIVGYNRTLGSNDFAIIPELRRRPTERDGGVDTVVRFNELDRGDEMEPAWLELYNPTTAPQNLSGWILTDTPDSDGGFALPAGTVIAPRGFLVVNGPESALALGEPEVRVFLRMPDGKTAAATTFDRPPEPGSGRAVEARFPDGSHRSWISGTPTPGEPNEVSRDDAIVVSEIFYHPPEERAGEFIELFHRGDATRDLSGYRFSKGIEFTFPAGTTIEPGAFVVVAADPELIEERYGLTGVHGPYDGRLSKSGENVRLVDTRGNLVDEVSYRDGGDWPGWPDGGGSSLELIDPRQDNDFALAWEASDETQKSEWEEHRFGTERHPAILDPQTELHMFLVDRGVCRVDELSLSSIARVEERPVELGTLWRYAKGTEPFSAAPLDWILPSFDDSGWLAGPAEFSTQSGAMTVLDDMVGMYTSVAMRHTFPVSAEQLATAEFLLRVRFNDGLCAYVNGIEAFRENCPEQVAWDEVAPTALGTERTWVVPNELLREGENTLAIAAFNVALESGDFEVAPRLLALSPGAERVELVPNTGFEEGTEPWIIDGTHEESRQVTDEALEGNACLEIVATGKGDSLCNRLEVDTAIPIREGCAYDVSLWTRWLRGSSLLIVHADFSEGDFPGGRDRNLSGNAIAARLRMTVPLALGTPGRMNSVAVDTSDGGLGPVISEVSHTPPIPSTRDVVRVNCRVSDADGVAGVQVFFQNDDLESAFESVDLEEQGMGLFAGELPPAGNQTQIRFYLEATDQLGRTQRYPRLAPEKSLFIFVEDTVEAQEWAGLQVVSDGMISPRLFSNTLTNSTVVLDGQDVFYNVGVRHRGSPWGRPQRQGLRLRFPRDHLLQGARRAVNLNNRDRGGDGPSYFLIGRSGSARRATPAPDYKYIPARVNHRNWGVPGFAEPLNRDFLQKWYGNDGAEDGILLKANGRLWFNDNCSRQAWDEAVLHHRGDNTENYRFYWFHSISENRDDWEPFIEATKVLDVDETPDEEFDELVDSVMDTENFLRVLAARFLLNDGDVLFIGNGHNGYMWRDPHDGLWSQLPFDHGFSGNSPRGSLLGFRDPHVARLLSRPQPLRLYYRILEDLRTGYWNEEAAGPYFNALREDVGVGSIEFVRGTEEFLQRSLEPFVGVPLRITTAGGQDFESDGESVVLEGDAPVGIEELLWRRDDGDFAELSPEWVSAVRWRTTFSLQADSNRFEVVGTAMGETLATTSITVHRAKAVSFLRGDVDHDLRIRFLDPFTTLAHLFGRESISCRDAADANDDGLVDLTDAVLLLEFLFVRGAPPALPFPEIGIDTTEDSLDCGRGPLK